MVTRIDTTAPRIARGTRPAARSPQRRYLTLIRTWIGSRAASRRRVRTALRRLDPRSRRRIVHYAMFNIVRSLNEAAGAPTTTSGATTNRMLSGRTEPLRAARPLVNLYRRTSATKHA